MMYKIKYSYPNRRSLTIYKDTLDEVIEALPKYIKDCDNYAHTINIEAIEGEGE